MNLFGVLFTVLVVVLLAGLGLVVWGLVEGRREHNRTRRRRQYCEQLRIHHDARRLARQLQCEAYRVRADMLRHVVQRMDQPQRPHRRPGGRHG